MKNGKRIVGIGLVVAFTCFAVSSISCLALAIQSVNLNGEISTGIVKCSSAFDDSSKEKDITPGDTIKSSFTVKNTGTVDSVCRVKIDKKIKDAKTNEVDDTLDVSKISINYNKEKWKAYNGYFYYSEPLKVGGTSDSLINDITYDISADNSYKNKKVCITAETEVVQATGNGLGYFNIKPDDIGYSESKEKDYKISSLIELKNKGFTYNLDAQNVFKNFSNISADESRSQIIEVKNSSSEKKEILMSISNINDSKNILQNIRVNMYIGGSSIFSGDFNDLKDISLGTFNVGESKELMIKISSTEGIGNTNADSKATLDWNLTAVSGGSSSTYDEVSATNPRNTKVVSTPIKTGIDITFSSVMSALCLVSGVVFILLLKKRGTMYEDE